LKLETIPIPTAAASEVVIKVEACHVCDQKGRSRL
jgi:D-arabinose 1-dehydrogenase-like Zn-dependent alcohol dehydrogenase